MLAEGLRGPARGYLSPLTLSRDCRNTRPVGSPALATPWSQQESCDLAWPRRPSVDDRRTGRDHGHDAERPLSIDSPSTLSEAPMAEGHDGTAIPQAGADGNAPWHRPYRSGGGFPVSRRRSTRPTNGLFGTPPARYRREHRFTDAAVAETEGGGVKRPSKAAAFADPAIRHQSQEISYRYQPARQRTPCCSPASAICHLTVQCQLSIRG